MTDPCNVFRYACFLACIYVPVLNARPVWAASSAYERRDGAQQDSDGHTSNSTNFYGIVKSALRGSVVFCEVQRVVAPEQAWRPEARMLEPATLAQCERSVKPRTLFRQRVVLSFAYGWDFGREPARVAGMVLLARSANLVAVPARPTMGRLRTLRRSKT